MTYDRAKLYFEVTFSLTSPSQILSSLFRGGVADKFFFAFCWKPSVFYLLLVWSEIALSLQFFSPIF